MAPPTAQVPVSISFIYYCLCRPYFEAKARLNQSLDDQKRQIQLIEETIQMTKMGYADSLKQLEKISEEIHERRRKDAWPNDRTLSEDSSNRHGTANITTLGTRQEGVGAEFPSPYSGDKVPKQTSKNHSEDKNICEMVNNGNNNRKPDCNTNSGPSDGNIIESINRSAKDNQSENESVPKVGPVICDEVDCVPLVGDNMPVSKKYIVTKGKKLRRKKYENIPSKSLPDNSPKASCKKKAINDTRHREFHTEASNDPSVKNESHQESSEKRKSVSSCSTIESVDNDGTSGPNSVVSNCSRLSSRGSSSDTTSSDSPSTESSPKMTYERLNISKKHDTKFSEFLTNTPSSSAMNTSKENLGLPIHPFENNLKFELGDTAKSRNMSTDVGKITLSPIKKNYCPTTVLTNKYLNIKQEESELSDAESLARYLIHICYFYIKHNLMSEIPPI